MDKKVVVICSFHSSFLPLSFSLSLSSALSFFYVILWVRIADSVQFFYSWYYHLKRDRKLILKKAERDREERERGGNLPLNQRGSRRGWITSQDSLSTKRKKLRDWFERKRQKIKREKEDWVKDVGGWKKSVCWCFRWKEKEQEKYLQTLNQRSEKTRRENRRLKKREGKIKEEREKKERERERGRKEREEKEERKLNEIIRIHHIRSVTLSQRESNQTQFFPQREQVSRERERENQREWVSKTEVKEWTSSSKRMLLSHLGLKFFEGKNPSLEERENRENEREGESEGSESVRSGTTRLWEGGLLPRKQKWENDEWMIWVKVTRKREEKFYEWVLWAGKIMNEGDFFRESEKARETQREWEKKLRNNDDKLTLK